MAKNPLKDAAKKSSSSNNSHDETISRMQRLDEVRLNVNMDRSLYSVFKTLCVSQDRSIREVVEELVNEYIDHNDLRGKVKELQREAAQV